MLFVVVWIDEFQIIHLLQHAEPLRMAIPLGTPLFLWFQLAQPDDRLGPVHPPLKEDQPEKAKRFKVAQPLAVGANAPPRIILGNRLSRFHGGADDAIAKFVGQ
jgi:hypothetical protein